MPADYGMERIGSTKRIIGITDSNKAAGFTNKKVIYMLGAMGYGPPVWAPDLESF